MRKSVSSRSAFGRFVYSWRNGNDVELFVDGGAFFPAMLDSIDAARTSVALAIYQTWPGGCLDSWINRLKAAAGRGVAVNLLVDGFGGFPARDELRALRDAGVTLRWFNPASSGSPLGNLFRDHRKLLIIDEKFGFIGGFCLVDEFDPRFKEPPTHEIALRVCGPVVEDLCLEFERDWLLYGGHRFFSQREVASNGQAHCRLVRNHPRGMREVSRSAIKRIESASTRAWLVTPYFAPPRRLMRAMRRAASRGVDVRVLAAGDGIDHSIVRFASWRYSLRLLRAGARAFEYERCMLHMKCLLVDDWVSAGSCNLNHWEMRWNRDANIEIEDQEVTKRFAELMQKDFASSRELSVETFAELGILQRIARWFANLVEGQARRWAFRNQLRLIRKHPGRPRPRRTAGP